ncbi:MAG: endolytic transglycosylase MltG, partial [Bacteroidota bacterium]
MKKFILWIFILGLIAGGYFAYTKYIDYTQKGSADFVGSSKYFFLSSASNLDEVTLSLAQDSIISDPEEFLQVASLKKFESAKPGRYRFSKDVSHNQIINQLRIGDTEAVKVVVASHRLMSQIAGNITRNLQADSLELLNMMNDPEVAKKYGFSEDAFRTMFLPNTYQMDWLLTEEEIVKRFAMEYKRFWTEERIAIAKE